MGLDHWFWKQRSFFIYDYDRDDVECRIEIIEKGEKVDIDPKRLQSIRETIAVMRNGWMIHDWIERKMGELHGDTYIHYEDLRELRDVCNAVLADHSRASELLPTPEDMEYDEYYFEQVENLSDELNRIDIKFEPFVSYVYAYSY